MQPPLGERLLQFMCELREKMEELLQSIRKTDELWSYQRGGHGGECMSLGEGRGIIY